MNPTKRILSTATFLSAAIASIAIADTPAPGTGAVPDDINQFIPDAYKSLPVVSAVEAFSDPAGAAMCRNGLRLGDATGKLFIKSLSPTCDDLISPFGDEWVVPSAANRPMTPFNLCFTSSYARAVQETVLNTSINCAVHLTQNVLITKQLEYNRCYLETANNLANLPVMFVNSPNFVTGNYVLIPRDSAAWDAFITSLTVTLNPESAPTRSDIEIQACNIGIADAKFNREPRNFFAATPGN